MLFPLFLREKNISACPKNQREICVICETFPIFAKNYLQMRKLLLTILMCVFCSNIFAQASITADFDGKKFKTEDRHTGKENVNIKFTTK